MPRHLRLARAAVQLQKRPSSEEGGRVLSFLGMRPGILRIQRRAIRSRPKSGPRMRRFLHLQRERDDVLRPVLPADEGHAIGHVRQPETHQRQRRNLGRLGRHLLFQVTKIKMKFV